MKKFITTGLFLSIFFFAAAQTSVAQNDHAVNMFKKHINEVVQKVEKTEKPEKKRELLNSSFNKLLTSFDKVERMKTLSVNDKTALDNLRANITEKKNELNGLEGYRRVPDNQLNNFAHFVQQDLEQADTTITLSVTVILLIIIIILLL